MKFAAATPSLTQLKLSQILLRMVEPFMEEDQTRKDMQGLIAFASLVWNAVVLEQDGEPGHELLLEHFRQAGPTLAEPLMLIAKVMRQYKLDRHPSDRRLVLDYTVQERADDFNVRVVSSDPGPAEPFAEALKKQARKYAKASGRAVIEKPGDQPVTGPATGSTEAPAVDPAPSDMPWLRRNRRPL